MTWKRQDVTGPCWRKPPCIGWLPPSLSPSVRSCGILKPTPHRILVFCNTRLCILPLHPRSARRIIFVFDHYSDIKNLGAIILKLEHALVGRVVLCRFIVVAVSCVYMYLFFVCLG